MNGVLLRTLRVESSHHALNAHQGRTHQQKGCLRANLARQDMLMAMGWGRLLNAKSVRQAPLQLPHPCHPVPRVWLELIHPRHLHARIALLGMFTVILDHQLNVHRAQQALLSTWLVRQLVLNAVLVLRLLLREW